MYNKYTNQDIYSATFSQISFVIAPGKKECFLPDSTDSLVLLINDQVYILQSLRYSIK